MPVKDKKTRDVIEESGKLFELFDLTPMQGRIVAYLTVSDTPEKTFDDIVNYFKASKSSISNSLNYLLQVRILDYKTYASDRKRYFYLTDAFFRIYFARVLTNVTKLKEYAYKAVATRSPEYPQASEKILKWIENANRFEEALSNTLRSLDGDELS